MPDKKIAKIFFIPIHKPMDYNKVLIFNIQKSREKKLLDL